MKTLFALPALLGSIAIAGVDARAASAAPPSYDALPQATLTAPAIDHPPLRVAANEKVDGFTVAYPPKQMTNGKPSYVMVAATEAMANPFTGKAVVEPDGTCFAQTMNVGKDAPPQWMPHTDGRVALMIPTADNREPAVHALRSEKLVVQGGGKAALEVTYAWVDPTTRGVRLITRESVPLAAMATGPSGVTVFGVRDAKSLDVIVKSSDPEGGSARRVFNLARPLSGTGPDGQAVSASCGHARVRLRVEPQAAEMAQLAGDVDLAPVQEQAIQSAGPAAASGGTEFRLRPLRVTVSSTWLSRDKQPVLSVSFGWSGAEKSQPF